MIKQLATFVIPLALLLGTGTPSPAQTTLGVHVGPIGMGYAHDAPPRPRMERRGRRPGRHHHWVGGYWERQNDAWAWSRGRWEEPRERGAHWVRPRYHHEHDGYRYEAGRWER
ncbi:hypothetical protein [Geothrix sp. 21YS21S-2]|uniref:hypothetical protein n=1 Tax=Geothrix sp. 21YS21S-2 TaxID=3068893 RepID=UPI0027B8B5DA|nr:hypothetical protein [Geothrix sp. 21YS21S-2]